MYCRYCTEAVAQSEEYAWCEYEQRMVRKDAKRKNCKGYELNHIDAFYAFRGLEVTDPRAHYHPREEKPDDGEQISMI